MVLPKPVEGLEPLLIKEGDLVIVYESYTSIKSAYMDSKGTYTSRFGNFLHKVRCGCDAATQATAPPLETTTYVWQSDSAAMAPYGTMPAGKRTQCGYQNPSRHALGIPTPTPLLTPDAHTRLAPGLDWHALWRPRAQPPAWPWLGATARADTGAVDAGAAPPHSDPVHC
jgi:hypothetical protein